MIFINSNPINIKAKLFILLALSFFSLKAQTNYNVYPANDYFNRMGLCLYPVKYTNQDEGIIAPDDSTCFHGLLKNALTALGFKNVRLPIPIFLPHGRPAHMQDSTLVRQRLKELYTNYGVKTTLIINHYSVAPWNHTHGLDTNRMDNASYLDEIYHNGGIDYIEAVEGLNEPEHFIPDFCDPVNSYHFYNANWHKITYRVQKGLYQKCSSPPFNNIKVYGPSLWKYWYAADSLKGVYPYDIENYFQYSNLHPYPGLTHPGDLMTNARLHPSLFYPLYLNDYSTITNSFATGKPKIVTETGYVMNQYPAWQHPANVEISPTAAAKYFSFLPFELFDNDAKKVFIFKLHHDSSDPDLKQQFGLLLDNTPTPAFNTLKNISSILADTNTILSAVPLIPLTMSTLNPSDFGLRVYQQKDNQFLIAVWRRDPQSVCYDVVSDNNSTVPPKPVTIFFQSVYDTISIYDPFTSDIPVTNSFNASSVNIALTDRVILIQLKSNNTTHVSGYNNAPLQEVSVYPNPFVSHLTIEFEHPAANAELKLFNIAGQQVMNKTVRSSKTLTLTRDQLPAGIYFIHLLNDNKTTITHRVIISD